MKKNEKNKNKRGTIKALPLFLLTAGLIVVVAILANNFFNQKEPVAPIVAENTLFRTQGAADAPVIITEFADFGCITCKVWHQFGIKEQVLEKYGDQVRFVWH